MSEPMNDTPEEVELPELTRSVEIVDEAERRLSARTYGNKPTRLCLQSEIEERERQLKAAMAANREKDAEIAELIRKNRDFAVVADELGKLVDKACDAGEASESELDSLRASVGGEKWIEIVQDYRNNHVGCSIRVAGLMHGTRIDDRCITCIQADKLLAPPSLPTEKE